MTAPYRTIDDTGRVQLSQDVMTKEGVSNATLPSRSFRVPDRKIREMPAKKVSRYGFESLLQSIDLEPSSKHAATATWDITSDFGGQLSQITPELEDLLDQYGDGLWRCNDNPAISDGGPRENS